MRYKDRVGLRLKKKSILDSFLQSFFFMLKIKKLSEILKYQRFQEFNDLLSFANFFNFLYC